MINNRINKYKYKYKYKLKILFYKYFTPFNFSPQKKMYSHEEQTCFLNVGIQKGFGFNEKKEF